MIIYILYYLVFKILSSFVRDSSYHNMYYKGCGLLCVHKKSFNTAIPVRSLGPYMYVHYCTCIVHVLVSTYLFLLTSFFDCLSFCGLFLKHPYKRFFPFYIIYFYQSRSLSLSLCLCTNQFKYTYNAKYPTYSQHHITLIRVPAPAGGRISTVPTRDNVTPAAAVAHAIGYDICTDNLLVT